MQNDISAILKILPDWRTQFTQCPRCLGKSLIYGGKKDERGMFCGRGFDNDSPPYYEAFICLICGRDTNVTLNGNEEDPDVFRILSLLGVLKGKRL